MKLAICQSSDRIQLTVYGDDSGKITITLTPEEAREARVRLQSAEIRAAAWQPLKVANHG